MVRLKSFVCGSWFEGTGKPALLVNPATEAPLGEANSDGVDFAAVLHHARTVGGPALRGLTFGQRGELLMALSKVLHAHREELLDLAQANGGNTRGDAKFDVDGAIGTLAAYAVVGEGLAKKHGDRTFLPDGEVIQPTRSTRFAAQHVWMTRPGVAVHINAFNFPAWGTFEKVAVAFLAGVPVVTKPATATALVTFRAVELLVASGKLPEGTLQLICGSTGNLLSLLGSHDSLAFTGSNTTGSMLRVTPGFAEKGIRVNVEADSLNAAVVGADVAIGSDLWNLALRHVVTDMTQKTGQKCTAIRRVMVPESLMDDFQDGLTEALGAVVVGDPVTDGVSMGPVSTASQLRDGMAGIRELASEARIVFGGAQRVDGRNAPAGQGYYLSPTVLRAPSADGTPRVHALEVFGPVVTLVPYDGSAAEAARIIGLGQGSLVSTAYADDRGWIETFAAGAAPWLGRLLVVSTKVADQVTAPGMVLPSLNHGGPGRAGGGEELGGERGLLFYMQRTAIQGDRVILGKLYGNEG